MKSNVKNVTWFLSGLFIFFSIFFCIVFLYVQKTNVRYNKQFTTHATIITDDVWQLNSSGTKSYLQLAVEANHYKNLSVRLEEGNTFLKVTSLPLTGIDKLLQQLKLIRTTKLSSPIEYGGQRIGVLQGEQYVRIVYPLLNIFVFQLLIALTALFIIYLFNNRKFLEKQILDRTKKHRESEERFHDLVNLLPEMIVETNAQGIITFANKVALDRFEIPDLENVDYNCFDIIDFKQNEQELDAKNFWAWTQQDQSPKEYRARDADGSLFPVLIRSAPIYTENRITGSRSIVIDITERCTLEEQLHRAQKMETIGLMAGGVAHDLNNILSGVINYPELILMKLPQDSNLRPNVESIRKSGLQAAEVVADLLTVARGIAATKKITNLNELIREYLESPEFLRLQSLYPQLSCKTELDLKVSNISCSSIHVRKCLMNLITNAAEAMDGIGQVTISTTSLQVDHSLAAKESIEQGAYTILDIHDTGPGISPHDMDHIFEPFYTKKKMGRSGTGLGLAVVWNTMQDHHGGVIVKSSKNNTTFKLFFPCTTNIVAINSGKRDWKEFEGKGETILVVDDEVQQRDIASQLLTSLGYRVKAVSSGNEAIDYLSQHPVDLIVLDMIMEPGLNGRQTYEKILQNKPGQKAVIASGFSESDDVKATIQLGAGGLINKPYTKEQLAQIVHRELNKENDLRK